MKKVFSHCIILCCTLMILGQPCLLAQEPAAANGKYATINGLKLYYEESGAGMPLILLHAFSRTAADYALFIPALSTQYRVIAIDLPGHGRSDYMDTTDVYLHKRAAEYIIGLCDMLHIDSAHIMGISSGAFVTTYMATMRPQLTRRIIIMAGQVTYTESTRKAITALGGYDNRVTPLSALYAMHGQQKGLLIARQFWNFRLLTGDPHFTPEMLSSIKARALIIHGDNDPVAPVSNAWEMYQHIPKSRLWIVPNGGHVPIMNPNTHDDFLRRIQEFLRGDWERR